jgi:hypothetical protein
VFSQYWADDPAEAIEARVYWSPPLVFARQSGAVHRFTLG